MLKPHPLIDSRRYESNRKLHYIVIFQEKLWSDFSTVDFADLLMSLYKSGTWIQKIWAYNFQTLKFHISCFLLFNAVMIKRYLRNKAFLGLRGSREWYQLHQIMARHMEYLVFPLLLITFDFAFITEYVNDLDMIVVNFHRFESHEK